MRRRSIWRSNERLSLNTRQELEPSNKTMKVCKSKSDRSTRRMSRV